jgi:hypothetical protein
MKLISFAQNKLVWLNGSLRFFRQHFYTIFLLGLIAGFGRVIQLGGFGEITASANLILEVVIESARLATFFYIFGSASFKKGFLRIGSVIRNREKRTFALGVAARNLKSRWRPLLLNISVYLLIAWTINLVIDKLAYETCLYLAMQERGILHTTASEWTIILFFKNLSVIPLTFIFNTLLIFYLTDKWQLLAAEAKPKQVSFD